MDAARTISALIVVGSLVGCSSGAGLPTQRAYGIANIEQPQSVSFYCGTILAVGPAILPNSIPPGIGITPSIGPWLVGLHGGSSGPNASIQVSAGFIDLNGIASAPSAPLTEYTVMLNNGEAVVVVQDAVPDLYGAPPNGPVFIRVVGNSYRVMPNTGLPPGLCAQGPLQTIQASYPNDVTLSYLGSGGVVYMHYPPRGIARY
jgi:hypothetical protein